MAGVQRDIWLGNDAVHAATEVFNQYGSYIRAVIRFQTHNRSDQEDLFQEFFLALIHRPIAADVQNIKSYLYRAIVNHILDSARGRDNYRRAVKKYARNVRISINNRRVENVILEEQEEKDATIAYFAGHLQEREAQAFVLRYRDNFSVAEIATRMGVNARTVSRYLSEGLKKLRNTLAKQ